MKYLVVDPVSNSLDVCFLSVYDEDSSFLYQYTISPSNPQVDKIIKQDFEFLCFDAFKTMRMFEFKFAFLYDVKVLYELAGYDFRSLIDLGKQILGEGRLEHYEDLSSRMKAHIKSYRVVGINIGRYNRKQLLPQELFENLYLERSAIIAELYNKFNDEDILKFYKTMFKSVKELHVISSQPVHIDLDAVKDISNHHISSVRKNISDGKIYLKFNAVGAKTGRLSLKKGTVNIYGMPKVVRKCIVPRKGCTIVQFDFKSFQPRLAIFSTEDEEFKSRFKNIEDIYSIFPGDRSKNKIAFIAWMFSNMRHELFGEEAKPIQEMRDKLYQEAVTTGRLTNNFGRVLYFRNHEKKNAVYQNYITSLEVDVILTLVRWINPVLKNRKSKILFPFHDSIVFEIHENERELIPAIKNFMESFHHQQFGTLLPVEAQEGGNFGEMNGIHC